MTASYFYPRPPRGGRLEDEQTLLCYGLFLSTPSARRATVAVVRVCLALEISIHALREEGDDQSLTPTMGVKQFLSTPSARRATYECFRRKIKPFVFLSTPSARRATRPLGGHTRHSRISIHALREEGDRRNQRSYECNSGFLSTPSARRATHRARPVLRGAGDFYPRPPRGGRLSDYRISYRNKWISIHALREEGDHRPEEQALPVARFLSTPSARRATRQQSPSPSSSLFLSTPSARRATWLHRAGNRLMKFLSTPSARRATLPATRTARLLDYFYPRPPRGGRPFRLPLMRAVSLFLSTPSARRATRPAQG